ncbi:MAG: chemotaxis-specific protein-glutamate methyltransferase CheB [Dehalococcoidia bacterium]|nr:chemotaxis-specific protein-glutamate methyltransferase CheB [Dehalococcoidia bacterium]
MHSLPGRDVPLRVVLVDDSATVRAILRRALEAAGVAVVGVAGDGLEALEVIARERPDVVTLDVEMPRMDGLATLGRLMAECPVPVVMVSTLTSEGAEATIRALELGAVDFIEKPSFASLAGDGVPGIVERLANAARARPAPAAEPPLRVLTARGPVAWQRRVVVIGASTGGPQTLKQVVAAFPEDFGAPVVIVQHMPPGFTRSLAERLASLGPLPCAEAEPGMPLLPGQIMLAAGGHHLEFDDRSRAVLSEAPPEHGVRPAVNVTLESVSALPRARPLAVILTGMGRDGVRGARLVRRAGGTVLAQDEATSIVYGMPRSVVEAGLADEVVALGDVAPAIVRHASRRAAAPDRDVA